ncbi:5256_t:CDS:2 [Ambispora leptoticha]|uniref:5256_t:CDS:1 n=1 Tax=Ambispora leptoticha TaxID=144679 RepID=A0A9N9ANB4_9GLOM|nr:5256_t:CDS:2 [Ambispora leptoticha]
MVLGIDLGLGKNSGCEVFNYAIDKDVSQKIEWNRRPSYSTTSSPLDIFRTTPSDDSDQ